MDRGQFLIGYNVHFMYSVPISYCMYIQSIFTYVIRIWETWIKWTWPSELWTVIQWWTTNDEHLEKINHRNIIIDNCFEINFSAFLHLSICWQNYNFQSEKWFWYGRKRISNIIKMIFFILPNFTKREQLFRIETKPNPIYCQIKWKMRCKWVSNRTNTFKRWNEIRLIKSTKASICLLFLFFFFSSPFPLFLYIFRIKLYLKCKTVRYKVKSKCPG